LRGSVCSLAAIDAASERGNSHFLLCFASCTFVFFVESDRTITDPTKRFSDRASFYVRARPSYPVEILGFFRHELGLTEQSAIADVGSGTGSLTRLLLQLGGPVYAVEPNGPMRRAAEEPLGQVSNFHSVDGTAETTGLADHSVDLVAAGQAFHWFDAVKTKAEFRRILRPPGWVALVWNVRKSADDGFGDAYQRLTDEFREEPRVRTHQSLMAGDRKPLADFFSPEALRLVTFSNSQTLDFEGLQNLLLSRSAMPLAGPRHEEMIRRLKEIFAAYQSGGMIRMLYETDVFHGRLLT
jgi:SAM-dependent methyltransferase